MSNIVLFPRGHLALLHYMSLYISYSDNFYLFVGQQSFKWNPERQFGCCVTSVAPCAALFSRSFALAVILCRDCLGECFILAHSLSVLIE